MGSFQSITINKFLGMNTSRDELSLVPGQLSWNQNYLYMPNGGLEERGGGAKLSNSPDGSNKVYSLANYTNENGQEFKIRIKERTPIIIVLAGTRYHLH